MHGIDGQRLCKLALRCLRLVQIIAVDDGAIHVHFLGTRHPGIERLLIGIQRVIETARLTLQQRQIEPALGQLRPLRQNPLIGSNRLGGRGSRDAAALPRATSRQELPRSPHWAPAPGVIFPHLRRLGQVR